MSHQQENQHDSYHEDIPNHHYMTATKSSLDKIDHIHTDNASNRNITKLMKNNCLTTIIAQRESL